MANTRLHLGSGNILYYENGTSVKVAGYPVKKSNSSNTTWYTTGSGREVKEFKGKTILDLEKILGYVCLLVEKRLKTSSFLFFYFKYAKIIVYNILIQKIMNPSSKEVLTSGPNDKITINSVEDFKKRLHITNLPEGEIKNFFEQPLETTQSELDKLRKKYLSGEPDLSSVKEFLQNAKNSILEETKAGVNQVKEVAQNIQKSIKIEKAGDTDLETSGKEAENILNSSLQKLDKVSGKVEGKAKEALKDGTKKAGELVEKAKKTGYTVQLGEALHDAFSKLKNFDIFGALISLFKGLFGMFIGKETFKKAGDKAKEIIKTKISPEKIEATKNNIKALLLKTFPGKEQYINNILNNPKKLTNEKIEYFYQKIQKGEQITLKDLENEFKDLNIQQLLTEKSEKFKKELYLKIQKDLEKKYNKTLTTDQVQDLGKLISKYLTINNGNIEQIQNKINIQHQLQLKDIMPVMIDMGKNSIGFMFGLVSTNIVSINDIAMNFVDKGGELINLSLSSLGLSETININDLYEGVSEMNEKDKAILIALLYRKGGLFLNILGSLSALSSKILIETVLPTNSGVDGIKLLKDSLIHGNIKQIENFEKIEKALSGSKSTLEGTKFLKESIGHVKEIKQNFAILEIMKSSEGNIDKFYSELAKFEKETNINLNIEKYSDFDELRNKLSNRMTKSYASKHNFDIRDLKNKGLGFGIESALQDFNKNLEKIGANQARIAMGRINLNPFKKISDAIDISKTSKLGDSLLFELRSPEDAKAFLKQINELAKKSPELIKGIFDKLPIFAIGGLAATSEEPFFESMKNELPYLLPIVGPILMITDAGINWKTMPPSFIKTEQAVIGGGLLTLDGYFLMKAGLKGAPGYLLKPVKDIVDIGKGTFAIGQRLYKTGSVLENSQTAKSIFRNALTKTKSLKGKLKAIAIIALVGYGTFELALADDNNSELNKYFKNGKLDTEKIKKDSETLTKNEKIDLIKIILLNNSGEETIKNIDYDLKSNNTLSINSNNKKFQGDFFITNEEKEIFYNLFGINNYTFKYNKNPA